MPKEEINMYWNLKRECSKIDDEIIKNNPQAQNALNLLDMLEKKYFRFISFINNNDKEQQQQ